MNDKPMLIHVTMSDAWYEEKFKREHHYRKRKPKKCCATCKHCCIYLDSTCSCYANLEEYPNICYDVSPFGLCDKYEPKEEIK